MENKPQAESTLSSSSENPIKGWADGEKTLIAIFGADFVNKNSDRFEVVFKKHGWQAFSELIQAPSVLAPLDEIEEKEGTQILADWFAKYES